MQEDLKTIGLLNCLIIRLLSIPILISGIWYVDEPVDCDKFLQKPTIAFGTTLFVVAVAAVMAATYRLNWLLGLHLLGMLLVIAALLCFVVFAFAVTTGDRGRAWWRKRLSDAHNWNWIKACLVDGDFCKVVGLIEEKWLAGRLYPIEKGCCQQAEECNLMQKNSTNLDCDKWNDDPQTLCFNCESCKAGMVQELKMHWTGLDTVNLVLIITLIGVFFFGCFALYKNWQDNISRRLKLDIADL